MGFMKTPDEDETSNLIWCDSAVQQEKIAELQNYQVAINHDQLLLISKVIWIPLLFSLDRVLNMLTC